MGSLHSKQSCNMGKRKHDAHCLLCCTQELKQNHNAATTSFDICCVFVTALATQDSIAAGITYTTVLFHTVDA